MKSCSSARMNVAQAMKAISRKLRIDVLRDAIESHGLNEIEQRERAEKIRRDDDHISSKERDQDDRQDDYRPVQISDHFHARLRAVGTDRAAHDRRIVHRADTAFAKG